jgi:hypothetical protein
VAKADEKPSAVMTALSSTTLSGYVDTSAQWNLGTGNFGAPAYGFGGAGKADGFNLNVVDLNLEKDADPADGWGAGYRVELWLGPDATTLATTAGGAGGLAIKNAYVDLKAPVGTGLDIKVGVFDTPIGYEVADSVNNPNFTRSYGYSIEPTTHTGILLGYNVNDMLSLAAGIADSYGPGINARSNPPKAESYKTYMADATFTAPTNWGWVAGSTLSGGVINGFNGAAGFVDTTSLYLGSSLNTPIKELKLGASFDYVLAGKQGANPSGYAQAYALYATYQLTEKMSINGRGEYFGQSKGIAGVGAPNKVIEFTATLQYDLWKNVLSRIEARWDHDAGGTPAGGAYGGSNPGNATLNNSFELIAAIAYKF